MPIKVKCSCGKGLAVKEQFAGKAVKCPGCGKAVRVPAASGGGRPQQSSAARAAPEPAAAPIEHSLDDLFDEEGFGSGIASVCSACGKPMPPEAVLCTQCGYNKTTGQRVQGYLLPGVDVSTGDLALQKAEQDIQRADKLQRDMTDGSGMPWWMLGLILFILGSATALAVMAVMSATRTTGDDNFNAMRSFLQLAGTGCALVAVGAFFKLVVEGFKVSRNTGLLCLTVLYLFVFVFQKPKGRIGAFLVMLILGGTAAGLLIQSQNV